MTIITTINKSIKKKFKTINTYISYYFTHSIIYSY